MTKNQRLAFFGLLILVLAALFAFPVTRPQLPEAQSIVVLTALFMLSFTALLLEHFFVKPTDVISAAVSILFLLIPSRALLHGWGNWYWAYLCYEIAALVLATAALLLLQPDEPGSLRSRASLVLKTATEKLASGRHQYFVLSLLAVVFFTQPRSTPYFALMAYALAVMLIEPQKIALWLPQAVRDRASAVGELLAVEGGTSFVVRLTPEGDRQRLRLGSLVEFSLGSDGSRRRAVVVEKFYLDEAQWMRVVCHRSIDEMFVGLPLLEKCRDKAVYARSEGDGAAFFGQLAGFVADGSDVGSLRFLKAGGHEVCEGDLVEVLTRKGTVVYQVVNGRVDSEILDARNEADFVLGEAVQLGRWDARSGTFERHGWVPPARTPVTAISSFAAPAIGEDDLVLGTIPGTEIPVVLNRRDAISHHTAILGVTGVGKSVFARNLVREIATDGLRVIVVDFTREWRAKLSGDQVRLVIDEADAVQLRKAIKDIENETAKFKNQQDERAIQANKRILHDGFTKAIKDLVGGQERYRVFELPDVSNTEGVLEYTQWFFKTLFAMAREVQLNGQRVCIVLEEAHTVVPEWNFVGLADKSSQSLINNISQIALQGRKYDVGFIVIAQRTASVSKTVLTQCNTLIAFQCFDGTSLEFLGHYLPKQTVQALPNLGVRKAVAVGKAIRGSVPLIFQVPDLSGKELAGPMTVAGHPDGAAPIAAMNPTVGAA